MKVLNLRHKRFHRLFVLRRDGKIGEHKAWLCACDCGGLARVKGTKLISGKTKSCGCLLIEKSTTHGMSDSRELKTWKAMIDRCTNPKNKSFHRYGGRGIKVCPRWLESFDAFYSDMGDKPDGLTLERIDNSGPYSPENCRWASNREQCNNKRNNVILSYLGESLTVAQWARRTGLPYEVIRMRIKRGWKTAAALTLPPGSRG